jgi:hypothetical protein
MAVTRHPRASIEEAETDCRGSRAHLITADAAELRIHKEYGGVPAAPVILEELGGVSLQPGQFLLVSRATLDRLRGEGGRS